MESNKLLNDHFLHLADARDGTDQKQDQFLALLEAAPQTEAEALAILSTVHHRHERSRRNTKQRTCQLNFDPIAPQKEEDTGALVSALDLLPDKDQNIIRDHVLDGLSFVEIARQEGISKSGAAKRYTVAKRHLENKVKES
jgi:RNA polymerase sigma factor (sigma-70 family)